MRRGGCCYSGKFYILAEVKDLDMKHLILLLLLVASYELFGQTDSIEKVVFYRKYYGKEADQPENLKTWLKWTQTIKEMSRYPDLPLDLSGHVHYTFIREFGDKSKEKLFPRILEWISLNYGIVPAFLYSNLGDGKIIFRNNASLNSVYTCIYTSVISVKNEKIRVEYINLSYQSFYESHYSGETWIPDQTTTLAIDQFYPVILKKPSEWNSTLNLFKSTNDFFTGETSNLYDYILSYDSQDPF
jgi:hypothetical protein